ncbi:hypothetical protein HJC99_02255 [Candidatus Saccharibacteria bacterium]|nr:hypothetical protein [Candidatus Saccharibacteria bacterium]
MSYEALFQVRLRVQPQTPVPRLTAQLKRITGLTVTFEYSERELTPRLLPKSRGTKVVAALVSIVIEASATSEQSAADAARQGALDLVTAAIGAIVSTVAQVRPLPIANRIDQAGSSSD